MYRGQHAGQSGDGKELCDLLVVFDDHVIIFSDKEIKYPSDVPIEVAWARWFRSAIERSAKQVYGAERWIKLFPDRLYLDRACTQSFPVNLPGENSIKVHRIVVARGINGAARSHFGGGSGSLMLDSTLVGRVAHAGEGSTPFSIGQINPQRGFIHVLDDATLGVVLKTLDTTRDLTEYLTRKEKFLSSKRVWAAGEEELLAFYLRDVGEDGWNDFVVPDGVDTVMIEEGHWEAFTMLPQRRRQLLADRPSYAWDDLVERFAQNVLGDTQYNSTSPSQPFESEVVIRFLAREPRTRRRLLSSLFLDLLQNVGDEPWKVRMVEETFLGDPLYVFMAWNRPQGLSYEAYRQVRHQTLLDYMHCAKVVRSQATDVVGVAVGLPGQDDNSEDLAYLDTRGWSQANQAEAELLQEQSGYLKELNRSVTQVKSYPDQNETDFQEPSIPRIALNVKGRDRNQPCRCGSGRKFKKCCGRRI
ncbi:MAG: SEC-C domain-containing protein [Dehalococcoidia bacterium]